MNLTPEDIEKIVRQVLQTLLEGNTDSLSNAAVQPVASNVGAAPVLTARNAPVKAPVQAALEAVSPAPQGEGAVDKPAGGSEIALDEAVISATLLGNALPKGRDRTVQSVRVKPSAVITPAAKDLLRERRIQIVRGTPSQPNKSQPNIANKAPPRPQRLVVAGTSNSMEALGRHVCPKQANVLPKLTDDSAVLRSVLDGLNAGHQAAVVWVDSPHSVCWQAARHETLRPIVVSQWSDLSDAMKEVPANLLILSKKQWTIPALGNATRVFFEHLKKSN